MTSRSALALIALAMTLCGCAASPALLGAALGFGASALRLDDDLLTAYLCGKDPARYAAMCGAAKPQ